MIKANIDEQVALYVNRPLSEVSLISSLFIRVLLRGMVDKGEIFIDGFGTFTLRAYNHNSPVKVEFKPSKLFASRLRRLAREREERGSIMEKYGVDETKKQQDPEKLASQGCPDCGQTLVKHGQVLMCPTHGTEPFEKIAK